LPDIFRFKEFSLCQQNAPFKVGTDSVMLGAWTQVGSSRNALDIGTGTGLLALMLLQKNIPYITAVEVNQAALKKAALNLFNSGCKEQVSLIFGDVRNFNPSEKFDLIICNPPYFSAGIKSNNPNKNQARHSDSLPFSELIGAVSKLLSDNGRFAFILPFEDYETALLHLEHQGLEISKECSVYSDEFAAKPIRMLAEAVRKTNIQKEETALRIREDGFFSNSYRALTSDYYLNF
jgi:tRNA1Val (adenine37-N6)-methyltransferase